MSLFVSWFFHEYVHEIHVYDLPFFVHVQVHKESLSHVCGDCGLKFSSHTDLTKHRKSYCSAKRNAKKPGIQLKKQPQKAARSQPRPQAVQSVQMMEGMTSSYAQEPQPQATVQMIDSLSSSYPQVSVSSSASPPPVFLPETALLHSASPQQMIPSSSSAAVVSSLPSLVLPATGVLQPTDANGRPLLQVSESAYVSFPHQVVMAPAVSQEVLRMQRQQQQQQHPHHQQAVQFMPARSSQHNAELMAGAVTVVASPQTSNVLLQHSLPPSTGAPQQGLSSFHQQSLSTLQLSDLPQSLATVQSVGQVFSYARPAGAQYVVPSSGHFVHTSGNVGAPGHAHAPGSMLASGNLTQATGLTSGHLVPASDTSSDGQPQSTIEFLPQTSGHTEPPMVVFHPTPGHLHSRFPTQQIPGGGQLAVEQLHASGSMQLQAPGMLQHYAPVVSVGSDQALQVPTSSADISSAIEAILSINKATSVLYDK
jgi:hypothetical protein